MPKYALSNYDDYFCLKPPLLLWIATLYLSRAISLPIAVGFGHLAGVNADSTQLLDSLVSVYTLIPSALAVAVLYAMCRRLPNASWAVRRIWANGRPLLAAAAVIDGVVSVYGVAHNGDLSNPPLPLLLAVAFDVYFLLYILAAQRVRDTFADFPLLVPSQ